MSRIQSVSNIDDNGFQYILVFRKEPSINGFGWWEGGECFSFDIDHRKAQTRLYRFRYSNGVPTRWSLIKVYKDEIIDKIEAIKLIDEL